MSNEVSMTFVVEPQWHAEFVQAVALENRTADQVLCELMRVYVEQARQCRQASTTYNATVAKWTQNEAVAFECAREVMTDMHAILTEQIFEESGKNSPNAERLASLRAERSRLLQERAALRVKDHAEIARVRAQYGAMVRSWRADHPSMEEPS